MTPDRAACVLLLGMLAVVALLLAACATPPAGPTAAQLCRAPATEGNAWKWRLACDGVNLPKRPPAGLCGRHVYSELWPREHAAVCKGERHG